MTPSERHARPHIWLTQPDYVLATVRSLPATARIWSRSLAGQDWTVLELYPRRLSIGSGSINVSKSVLAMEVKLTAPLATGTAKVGGITGLASITARARLCALYDRRGVSTTGESIDMSILDNRRGRPTTGDSRDSKRDDNRRGVATTGDKTSPSLAGTVYPDASLTGGSHSSFMLSTASESWTNWSLVGDLMSWRPCSLSLYIQGGPKKQYRN